MTDTALPSTGQPDPPVGTRLAWTPEVFSYPVGEAFSGGSPIIDLTGRVRCLVHGPYVPLSSGVWKVDVRLTIDPERGMAPVRFEWGAEDSFVAAVSYVREPGEYTIALTRLWEREQPAQLRLWLPQPVFQGRIELLGATVTRMPDDAELTSGR